MIRIEYDKLIRDKIPELIEKEGKKAELRHIENNDEFLFYLNKKLVEEVKEYSENQDIIELADILEVILEIIKQKNISYKILDSLRKKKIIDRGNFSQRTILLAIIE